MVLRFERTTSVLPAAATSRLIAPPPAAPSIMPLLLSTMQQPMQPSISMSLGRLSFALAMSVSCRFCGVGRLATEALVRRSIGQPRRQHRGLVAARQLVDRGAEHVAGVEHGDVHEAA